MKQTIATFFFLALLATPLLLKPYFKESVGGIDREEAIKKFGFVFDETAKESGVDFKHSAPKLDPKLDNIMPQIASMGAGVAVSDFNNDGWNDFYLTNSGPATKNALFRNNKDGTFTDVAAEAGVADLNRKGASMGAVWGDYDNDGFEDLLVYKWGATEVYKNNGGLSFTRTDAGLPEQANVNTGIWFDFDRDGKLDIFLGGYFREDLDLWNLKDTKIMPESFEYAKNGGRNYLFRNLGNGRFEDVTKESGLVSTRWTLAAAAADINDDGFPDLFVSNDYAVSELYLNDGGKRFIDISESSGVGFSPKSGMNASFGDVLNNGKLSIYESNIYEEGNLLQGNNLWMPANGDKSGEVEFRNMAGGLGVENGGWSWSAQFGDLNNDGNLDLFVANGYVSADKTRSYWYDFATVTGGNESIISDAKNWAPMNGRSLSGYQTSRVWLNDGSGKFNDAAKAVGVIDDYDGRAVAFADLTNNGALDVIVASQNAPVLIYKTTFEKSNNWVQFDVKPSNNRSPVGTRITVFWGGMKQTQEINGGSGYCSQNQRRAHFGLGTAAKIDKVEIRWPDGMTLEIANPEVNKLHAVKQ